MEYRDRTAERGARKRLHAGRVGEPDCSKTTREVVSGQDALGRGQVSRSGPKFDERELRNTRFLSEEVAERYGLDVPPYEGSDQVVEVPVNQRPTSMMTCKSCDGI